MYIDYDFFEFPNKSMKLTGQSQLCVISVVLAGYVLFVAHKGLYIYYVITDRGGSFRQNMTIDDIFFGGSSTKIMTIWQ